jgi:hypothetical protein
VTDQEEAQELRMLVGDLGGKLNYCRELLTDLLPFIERALPTHKERGGEADRQNLLRRVNRVLSQLSATEAVKR